MNARSVPPLPAPDSDIRTACGGLAKFTSDSPRTLYQDRWIFFCLPACQQEFEDDPQASCYADQIAQQGSD